MPIALYALAMINFAVGTQGFAFAGVLSELAHDLDVSVGQAGLIVAAASITFAIGAPIAAGLVSKIERRLVILTGLASLALANAFCVLAPSFTLLVILRVAAGLATAFVGALATIAAASLVPPAKRGRAFALVLGGLTVAFVLGVPLGSVVGGHYGWRATFALSSIICLVAIGFIIAAVPRIPATDGPRPKLKEALRNTAVIRALILTLLGFTATFTVVSFIGPVIKSTTGLAGAGVGALQIFIGLGSIAGLMLGGYAADAGRSRAAAFWAFAMMASSLATYSAPLSDPTGFTPPLAMGLLLFVGATALFSLIPVNLAAISKHAGAAAPIALALNGSLVSLGQGVGALFGGFLADQFGAIAMGPGGALIAIVGLGLAMTSERRQDHPLSPSLRAAE